MAETVEERLRAAWARTDQIFDILTPDAWLAQPISLRHPFIFYVGHLPAFAWNHICGGVLERPAFNAAYDELFEGKFQEFGIFFSANMSIGFRRELAGVRYAQLRLARDKAFLEDMELDVSTGLAKGWRNIDANYELMQTNANRLAAAREEVNTRRNLIEFGSTTAADPEWLRSIQRLMAVPPLLHRHEA